jgi:catechol 2,3-dioxygenase-like lactoylglutathione lyase family enzyme
MLKKVVYVALLVSDQDKALDFYTRQGRPGVRRLHHRGGKIFGWCSRR